MHWPMCMGQSPSFFHTGTHIHTHTHTHTLTHHHHHTPSFPEFAFLALPGKWKRTATMFCQKLNSPRVAKIWPTEKLFHGLVLIPEGWGAVAPDTIMNTPIVHDLRSQIPVCWSWALTSFQYFDIQTLTFRTHTNTHSLWELVSWTLFATLLSRNASQPLPFSRVATYSRNMDTCIWSFHCFPRSWVANQFRLNSQIALPRR